MKVRLPKPMLFGLFGAAGGLLGALVFAELLYRLLTPPSAAAPPEAQVAIAATHDVELYSNGRNTFPVLIARDGFTGPVTVQVEGLPPGLTAAPVTIPAEASEGIAVLIANQARGAENLPVRLIASADTGRLQPRAETVVQVKIIEAPRPAADVVFVLDVTASMQWAIDDLRNGIGSFARSLEKSNIDFRLGLVTFQDIEIPGEVITIVQFKGGPFTGDSETFREAMTGLKASGGGDIPETSLEAIAKAITMPYRKDATKVLLLITDAPPKPVVGTAAAVAKTAKALKENQFDSVNIVVTRFDRDVYTPLLSAGVGKAPGSYFDLGDVVRGDEGFEKLFATFGTAVTNAAIAKNPDVRPRVSHGDAVLPEIKSLQSGETSVAGSESALVLRSAIWTAAIAGLIGLALAAGQQYYLRGTRPGMRDASFSLIGGCIVGLIGGAAGQALFFLAPDSVILAIAFRILGWIILGGLAGAGLSFFIPNMKWKLGLIGGAIGGAAGAVAFMAAASATGDLVGRLLGGLVLGFFIGLMVAIAEAAFRQAWLDVRFGERETIRVTLGPEPVKVGGDAKACTIWAKGAPPVALRFFIREGQVICDDKMLGKEMAVPNGFTKAVGTLNVTVNTGSGRGTLSAPPPIPVKASGPPPLGGAKAPPPLAKPATAAPPPIMPAKPPTLSQPLPPKPAAAPPKPVAESEGCPSCGRKQSGAPGTRTCIICDRTF